jgi:DNA-binding transcriptional MerR regulator
MFTARQVVTLTGVPYSKLDFWARSGLIPPSLSTGKGSGSRRLYDRRDLVLIRAAWNLRKSGLSGKAMRTALDYVKDTFEDFGAIETRGKDVILKSHRGDISVLSKPGQLYLDLTLPVSEAITHVSDQIGWHGKEGVSSGRRKPPNRAQALPANPNSRRGARST